MDQLLKPGVNSKFDEILDQEERLDNRVIEQHDKTRALIETQHTKTRAIVAVLVAMCTLGLTICMILQIIGAVQLVDAKISSIDYKVTEMQSSIDQLKEDIQALKAIDDEIFDIRNEVENIHTNIILIRDRQIPPENTPAPAPEVVAQVEPVTYNTADLLQPTGFTADQFQTIIENTFATKFTYYDPAYYANFGQALYEVEQNWGFNALYLLGISGLESGYGTSGLATKANNSFGLIGMSFDSVYDSIMYEGELIKTAYIDCGRTNLVSIGEKYCPPTYEKWAKDVQWITDQYIKTANVMVGSM